MKILILDDDMARHTWFSEHYSKHELIHTYTARHCIEFLEHRPDLIHLDCDLFLSVPGAKHNVDGSVTIPGKYTINDSGIWAAHAIVQLIGGQENKPKIIIHSHNPQGGKVMLEILRAASFDVQFLPYRWQHHRELANGILNEAGLPPIPPNLFISYRHE